MARERAELMQATPRPMGERAEPWQSVATHTHTIRAGETDFEATKRQILAWCDRNRIRALGLGSPWEPVSARSYARYEGPDRDRYFAGLVDPGSVMDGEPIQALLADLNARAAGGTLFYQDNETPKSRYGHLWYFGFAYVVPAWHDYSQDRPITYYEGDPARELNPLTGLPHTRRAYMEVLAEQRARGAVGVWAHPTSWWREGEQFVTNIAAECVLHLLADGRLDGLAVMGYDACHRCYQGLWFHLLDTGATVPAFAETDCLLDREGLGESDRALVNRMELRGDVTPESIVAAARDGRSFASSGPFLALEVEGVPMGSALATSPGQRCRVRVTAHPAPGQRALSRVDLVGKGGRILASVERFEGGSVEFNHTVGETPSYLVARAFGEGDDPDAPRQQEIRHMAITNPVYLRAVDHAVQPVRTRCELEVGSDSPWRGGTVRFEEADGTPLRETGVESGPMSMDLPASARVVLLARDGRERRFHLAMENSRVQDLLRYLHDGLFLRDWPDLAPGEVPPEAFRLDDMRHALEGVTIHL